MMHVDLYCIHRADNINIFTRKKKQKISCQSSFTNCLLYKVEDNLRIPIITRVIKQPESTVEGNMCRYPASTPSIRLNSNEIIIKSQSFANLMKTPRKLNHYRYITCTRKTSSCSCFRKWNYQHEIVIKRVFSAVSRGRSLNVGRSLNWITAHVKPYSRPSEWYEATRIYWILMN